MSQSLRCRLGIHRWTLYGKPLSDNSYTACRRCGKHRSLWGMNAAHDVYRSGMDDQTKKQSKRVYFDP